MVRTQSVVVAVFVSCLASCGAPREDASTLQGGEAGTTVAPLPSVSKAAPLCGVDLYAEKRDAVCGVELYKDARSAVCGVEAYVERADLSCEGSYPAHSYEAVSTSSGCQEATAAPACEPTYAQTGYGEKKKQCGSAHTDFYDVVWRRARFCSRDAHLVSCRKPEFGVERYKTCRHETHGVERYNACRKPAFGIERYKTCSFYLDAAGVTAYIGARSNLVALMSSLTVTQSSQFYAADNNQRGLACLIKRLGQDPANDTALTEVKHLYDTLYPGGEAPETFTCEGLSIAQDIDAFQCSPSASATPKCKAWAGYRSARQWLEVTKTDVEHLLQDIVAKSDASVRDELTHMRGELQKATEVVR